MTDAAHAVGADVGGTHLRVARVDAEGRVVQVERRTIDSHTPDAVLRLLCEARDALGADAHTLPMGVGLAAQIWLETGTVAVAPNLGWRDVPFGKMLAEKFGKVRMVNDLNAIAVGEAHAGAGRAVPHMLCVFVGTGVGMGAVVNGIVVEGADGLATELGHVKVGSPVDGRPCGCGERGCLEAYTSGRHLPDMLAAKVAAGLPSPLFEAVAGKAAALSAGKIDAAVAAGDRAATAVWDEASGYLARAVGDAVTLFNPRVLVLGGGVLQAAPRLKGLLTERLRHYAARPAQTQLQIRETLLGDDAGIVGAALVARRAVS